MASEDTDLTDETPGMTVAMSVRLASPREWRWGVLAAAFLVQIPNVLFFPAVDVAVPAEVRGPAFSPDRIAAVLR